MSFNRLSYCSVSPTDISLVKQILTVKFIVPDEPMIMSHIVGIDGVSFVIMD